MLGSWITIIAMVIVFVFAVQNYVKQTAREKLVKDQLNGLQEEYDRVSEKSNFLQKTYNQMSTAAYKAKVARQLNMKREGEEVIVFPKGVRLIPKFDSLTPEVASPNNTANWKKWWTYFFDKS